MAPNPVALSVAGLDIRWYGLLIALGIALGILLAASREKRLGLPKDTALDLALCGVPGAILGARLYYVIFSWDRYSDQPLRALFIWEGGLAIYGGLMGGLVAGLIYARVRRLDFLRLADLAAPSFALGQAIGRWGNFFNQEAYGIPVTAAWLERFPLSVFIQSDGLWHFATFFYESLWCALILFILLYLEHRGKFTAPGDTFLTYLFLYAMERALVEGLRTDSLYWGPLRVSQALSLVIALVCGLVLLIRHGRRRDVGVNKRNGK